MAGGCSSRSAAQPRDGPPSVPKTRSETGWRKRGSGCTDRPRQRAPRRRGVFEPTFHEFASAWFAQRRNELKMSTADAIRWRLSYVLLPFFQHHRLSEITVAEVDRYRDAKVRSATS